VWDPHGLNFCVVTFEQVVGHRLDLTREDNTRRSIQEIVHTIQIFR
jgi:hypothetical protein